MTVDPSSPKNGKLLLSFVLRWQESLKWRIACAYGGVIMVLGLVVIGVAYQSMSQALRSRFDQQAYATATNLSDIAAGYMAVQQNFGLHAYVIKYARLDGIAYAFIEDRAGEVVAHSLRSFPVELVQTLSPGERRQTGRVALQYQGQAVYETRVPILEGQLGAVHLGVWAEFAEREIRRVIVPVIALIATITFAGVVLSLFLAHRIVRPIRELTDAAGKISIGELETPIALHFRDEVGELARSLERMRTSLKTAIWRLSRAG